MDKNFVTAEEVSAEQNNVKTLYRFVSSLSLLKKVIAPTLLVIFFAAATPPYFLWILGELVSCGKDPVCEVTHTFSGIDIVIPASLSTLLMIAVIAMFTRVAAWMSFELSGQWSTQEIQGKMMGSISGVRTTFFDENPSGRLINRLLGDYGMLRLEGVMSIGDTTNGLAEVLCVGLLIMVANPIAGALIVPVVLLYGALQLQLAPMMSHAREIRAIRVGDVLHRETDLIEGRAMFMLYNKQQNLLNRIYRAFEASMNIQLFYCKLMSWGMLWMGMISAAYAITVYAFLVYGLHTGTITATVAAVVITAVFNLNNLFFGLAWDMSFLGETASHARRAFFIIDLPDEVEEESHVHRLSDATDDVRLEGNIVFDHYAMSYRPDQPTILNNLSLVIPEGTSVGIVGRTGAGKSSLMQSLFRMIYHRGGDIRIGDRSIYSVSVDCVRRQFGVVPQDPYLFAGTIKFNLAGDLADIGDDKLREVLDTVGLQIGLYDTVLEGGKDYSVGERQLLCLARVILFDKQYVLMDEPTSSLDRRSDSRIQTLMRTVLADKTVITIAHRLESLADYDLIVELGQGRLLRQGTPETLMPLLRRQYASMDQQAVS